MEQRYDLLAISGLMLAAVFSVWLGLWGPVDLSKLQQWQTLMAAIIAPSLALLPATIAYKAAMAKVNFDREMHDAQERRRVLNVRKRLHFAVAIFWSEVIDLRKKMVPVIGNKVEGIRADAITLNLPNEIHEAWEHADVLDPADFNRIANVKYNFTIIQRELRLLDSERVWSYYWPYDPPAELAQIIFAIKDLERFLEVLVENLADHSAASIAFVTRSTSPG
jgi:hypothetical protein